MSEYVDLDERLATAVVELERGAVIRPPGGVRARGNQRRRRHAVAMTVTPVAVLAIVGGVALTLRPTSGSPVTPGVTGGPAVSSPATTAGVPVQNSPKAPAPVGAVDLARHQMILRDAQGNVLRTMGISAGSAAHPTPQGTFTVASKSPTMKFTATMVRAVPPDFYDMTLDWYIDLGPDAPAIYATPWRQADIGKNNVSHGDIGLASADAEWLYNHVAVGDKIEVTDGQAGRS